MLANSNAIILTPSPSASEEARWWRAFGGSWQADWRERRRDWRVALVLGLGIVLALCAGLQSALELQRTHEARRVATLAENVRWSHQGEKNPHSAAHYGVYVFKPVSILAALDPGVEKYVGTSVWLEAHKQNDFVYRPASDEPGAGRQMRLTPALMLQVLVPIAMIFLGFGMFAAERERAMLPTLRISGAPLSALGAARAAVLVCLGLIIALPACAVVLAVHFHSDAGQPFTDGATRTVLFALAYLFCLGTWGGLIAAVSAWAPSTRAALSALIGLWALLTLVVPRAAVELAQHAAPLPTMQQFRERVDAALGSPHDPGEEERQKQQLLEQYKVSTVEQLPVNWSGISLARGESHGNKVFDQHYGALFGSLQRQSDAIALAGWLSPAVVVAGVSSSLAGSDTASHIQFIRRAEQQRRLIQSTLNDAITRNPERDGKRFLGDRALWDAIPPFHFTYAPVAWHTLLLKQLLPLLAIFIASVLAAGFGIRRLCHGSLR